MTRRIHHSSLVVGSAFTVLMVGGFLSWVNAQDCPGLSGVEGFGPLNQSPKAITVVGDTAYSADLYGLTVYDSTDPSALVPLGELLLPDTGQGIVVSGETAFIADGGAGLQIVDVGDPTSPRLIAEFPLSSYASGIALSENIVYVADYSSGLWVVDVSNPAQPVFLATFDTPGYAMDVVIDGKVAYVADSSSGIEIIDVSDPSTPTFLGHYDLESWNLTVTLSGTLLYVTGTDGLFVLDVSDSEDPNLLGTFPQNSVFDGFFSGGRFFLVSYPGLVVVDVSDPSAPVSVGQYDADYYHRALWNSGDIAFLASDRQGIETVDISNPDLPSQLGLMDTRGEVKALAVSGGKAFVADGLAGLQIIDVSDPAAPVRLGDTLGIPGFLDTVLNVVVEKDRAYLAVDGWGLVILDISDPAVPLLMSSVYSPSPIAIVVSGEQVYIGDGYGVAVFDVSNASDPVKLGRCEIPFYPQGLFLFGDLLFAAVYNDGLQIIDVSDPTTPNVVGSLDGLGRARDVAVAGSVAYVATDNGLRFIDVSDPRSPLLLSSLEMSANNLALAGNLVFVTAWDGGLKVVDVSDPDNASIVLSFPTPKNAANIALDPATATAWIGSYATIHGIDLACPTCAGMGLEADSASIESGGQTALISVSVTDFFGRPTPGAVISGSTTLGILSAFVDNGDGSYTATLTSGDSEGIAAISVSVDGSQCSVVTEIEITGVPPYRDGIWIPVAVHAQGANASSWRTALGIMGVGNSQSDVTIRFEDAAGSVERSVAVAPGQQLLFDDVVNWVGGSGAAALSARSQEPFVMASRIYTALDVADPCLGGGTLGQFLKASDHEAVLTQGQSAWLPQLAETDDFRTNIALTNTGDTAATARVRLYLLDGSEVGSFQMDVGPKEWVQDNRPYETRFGIHDLQAGYAKVELLSGSGVIGYASVVDNTTNDPTTIPLVPLGQGVETDLWIPVASHAGGANGSRWRTDLGLFNPSPEAAQATVAAADTTINVAVCAGCQVVIEDILGNLGLTGSRPLKIGATQPLVATSRTYSVLSSSDPCRPSGTLGQYIPGSGLDESLDSGAVGWLPQLAENVNFRTNIALTNTGDGPAEVEVALFDSNGDPVGTYLVALDPGEWRQQQQPYANRFGITDLDAGHATIRVLSGSKVLTYASIVDNTTNDPTTIPVVIEAGK